MQVVHAILSVDQETTEKAAAAAAGGCFAPGVDTMSVKVVMKKLSRGLMRGAKAVERGSASARMSMAAGPKGRGSSAASALAKSGEAGGAGEPVKIAPVLQSHS